jgi:hypothetical protein
MAYKSGMLAEIGAILKTASIKKCICTLLPCISYAEPLKEREGN